MTKSELIDRIAGKQTQLSSKDVELAVKAVLEYMSQDLSEGGRIEIRGFGSFLCTTECLALDVTPRRDHQWLLVGSMCPTSSQAKNSATGSITVC